MTEQYWTSKEDLTTWEEILAYVRRCFGKGRWIFRGLSAWDHNLVSSLDLAVDQVGVAEADRWRYEAWMLYEFKRRAHHYLGACDTPKADDFLEWFSLMRHYGAPSRLLDFSYSFFVAAYFATSNASKDAPAAIYCVDLDWLVNLVDTKLVATGEFFQNPQVFWTYAMRHPDDPSPDRRPFLIPVRPFRSNNRIHVQQGLFLCPANVGRSFAANAYGMVSDRNELKRHIVKVRVNSELRTPFIRELKSMNITCETLYPGLDGFAGSVRDLVHLSDRLPHEGRLKDAIRRSPLW